jgi:flagellar biosynthesis component FlhA
MIFFAVFAGSALGIFVGGGALLWFLGRAAQKQQEQQLAELQTLQNQYLAMAQKENERLRRYAQMEG